VTDGVMLRASEGRLIAGGALEGTLKVGKSDTGLLSAFEIVVPSGFDVGAHKHREAQELFYVLDGELDLLAFEPRTQAAGDWHKWVSGSGRRYLRGGAGSLLFVPTGCPHAFANPTGKPARMLFLVAPSGHEDYLEELARLLQASRGRPDPADVAELRRRYDIEQLTPLHAGSG
jgi:oxalate decarboxylase/phosphoglucose isomerase-like protein (cupin superfamily)